MSLLNNHYLGSTNLYFSSEKATVSYGDSRKLFELRRPIDIPKGSHLMLALSSFNAPYTFYLVREGINDTFKVSTLYSGIWVNDVIITIPEGNYEITEIINAVNELFIANQGELRTLMSLAYNYTTSKFYITTSIQMSTVIISDITCFKIFGTEEDINYTYTDLSTLQFPNVADISGTSCLYVVVRGRNIHNENSDAIDGVIAMINVEVLPLQYIFFKPIEMLYFQCSGEHITNFDISVLDETYKEIDFNGGIWRIGFTAHIQYDKEVPNQINITDSQDNLQIKKETIEKN
jgi:hypothetical protein